MTNLKLTAIPDDRPVKVTVELPASVHRDLFTYAQLLSGETSEAIEPAKLIPPMLARFMASDRAFLRLRRDKSN